MRRITSAVPVCFFTVLLVSFGAFLCRPDCQPEAMTEAAPAETEAIGPGGLIIEGAGTEAATQALNVWVEAVFVELERGFTPELEERAGFKLSPPDGKAILNAEEKEKLLAAIQETPAARIVSSLTVLTVGGQQAQSEDVEEITYPTEYDTETIKVPAGEDYRLSGEVFMVTPGNWEKRSVGTILNVTPTVMGDGRIALVLMPEVTMLVDWKNYGNERYPIMQPMFRTWNKTTTVILPDGSCLVLKESPLKPLVHPRMVPPPVPKRPRQVMKGEATTPAEIEKASPQRQDILKKLETVIPEIRFENAPLTEVIGYLSRECDVNIIVDPVVFVGPRVAAPGIVMGFPGGPGVPPVEDTGITLRLKNVALKEVLKFVLRYKNLKYIVEDYAILICPVDFVPPESLETEIFRLATPGIGVMERPGPGMRPDFKPNVGETIKDFLIQSGVPWPEGSNVVHDVRTGTLVVTNTPTNMVLVRELIRLWDQPAPEVRDKPVPPTTLLTIISAKVVEGK